MTGVDRVVLRRLAEAVTGWLSPADAEFGAAASPSVVLDLLDQIEQLAVQRDYAVRKYAEQERFNIESRRSLCAENDALKARVAELERQRDAALALHQTTELPVTLPSEHGGLPRRDVACVYCREPWPCRTVRALGGGQ